MAEAALLDAKLEIGGLGEKFFRLLEAVEASGSINRAARVVGLSYKGAWLLLERAGNFAQAPLITTATGGARGGGSELTATGHELLQVWRTLAADHRRFLRDAEAGLQAHPLVATFLGRMRMKSTARNQFAGTVVGVTRGPVSAEVTLRLKAGQEIVAALTSDAAKRLKLKKGVEAVALVKASSVVLMTDFGGYRLSARNQLEGTIARIARGAVSSLVAVTLPGGTTVSATITNDAVEALGCRVGQAATAVFKAYAVIVAVKA